MNLACKTLSPTVTALTITLKAFEKQLTTLGPHSKLARPAEPSELIQAPADDRPEESSLKAKMSQRVCDVCVVLQIQRENAHKELLNQSRLGRNSMLLNR